MIEHKNCSQCGNHLPVTQFNKKWKGKLRSECKECQKKYNRKRVWKRDPHYTVYYIPSEEYVGFTNNLLSRMGDHKKHGKDVTGYKIIGQFDSAVKAHLVETLFHFIGFNGFHEGNTKESTTVDTQLNLFNSLKEIL